MLFNRYMYIYRWYLPNLWVSIAFQTSVYISENRLSSYVFTISLANLLLALILGP